MMLIEDPEREKIKLFCLIRSLLSIIQHADGEPVLR